MAEPPAKFTFGIYPFSVVGMANDLARGPADDLARLPGIIDQLRGDRPLLLRMYVPFTGASSVPTALSMVQMVAASGAPWEVILLFRFDGDDLTDWLQLIGEVITRFGRSLHSLQVTNEANMRGLPASADGCRAHVRRALREGVISAKAVARKCGAATSIGFSATPTFEAADDFWAAVRAFGEPFAESLDYVGLDFYPDVFGPPIPLEHLPMAVETILRTFRTRDLATGGIPATTPIRIGENGWPTGPARAYDRQAAALESIIRTVHRLRTELNITHYELFNLRDPDSSNDGSFYQFGLMRDDYTPKPAFHMYQRVIQELSE